MVATKQLPTRSAVPEELTWDLTPIYADQAAYEADIAQVKAAIPTVTALKETFYKLGRHGAGWHPGCFSAVSSVRESGGIRKSEK